MWIVHHLTGSSPTSCCCTGGASLHPFLSDIYAALFTKPLHLCRITSTRSSRAAIYRIKIRHKRPGNTHVVTTGPRPEWVWHSRVRTQQGLQSMHRARSNHTAKGQPSSRLAGEERAKELHSLPVLPQSAGANS